MKQPAVGVISSILVIVVSLGFIALFPFRTFATWVVFLTICFIPIQIVISVTWKCKHPGFAAMQGQPARGALLTLFAVAVGAIVATIHFKTVGGSVNPPVPMLVMCIISSAVIMFWLAIMWGGWPFTALIKNTVAAGLAMLAACYVINYLLFRLLFGYGFMQGAPVYVPALDPHGLFSAWNVLVFYLTANAVMFVSLLFDMWPFTLSPAVMRQPVLGIVWTVICLVASAAAFYIGMGLMKMNVVSFMDRVPIPFIFGTIIVRNMLHDSLFGRVSQPWKGVLNTVISAAIGVALTFVYGAVAPFVTGALKSGPPGYDLEIWLASALLGVTFPFLIFYAEFLSMWPLQKEPH